MLFDPMFQELEEVMKAIVEAPSEIEPFVHCTPGTWRQVQKVCSGWLAHDMTFEEEQAQAERVQSRGEATRTSAATAASMPDGYKARSSLTSKRNSLHATVEST